MKIIDCITAKKPSLSFEVFPPKTSANFQTVREATERIADLKPSFMSVTYGALGTGAGFTKEIAAGVNAKGVPALAHLTCVNSTKEKIRAVLDALRDEGIENILALRGDLPSEGERALSDFHHASELAAFVREYGGFCIGGACYPEGHPESANSVQDIRYLKTKVDAGCEFLTTQMFFDNNILYNFLYRLREAGVNVPVVAGIMPVTAPSQLGRILSISGNALPQRFIRIIDRYADNPAALRQAGIAFATEQIVDLYANGVGAVHIYTMNHPDVARAIRDNVSEIIR